MQFDNLLLINFYLYEKLMFFIFLGKTLSVILFVHVYRNKYWLLSQIVIHQCRQDSHAKTSTSPSEDITQQFVETLSSFPTRLVCQNLVEESVPRQDRALRVFAYQSRRSCGKSSTVSLSPPVQQTFVLKFEPRHFTDMMNSKLQRTCLQQNLCYNEPFFMSRSLFFVI